MTNDRLNRLNWLDLTFIHRDIVTKLNPQDVISQLAKKNRRLIDFDIFFHSGHWPKNKTVSYRQKATISMYVGLNPVAILASSADTLTSIGLKVLIKVHELTQYILKMLITDIVHSPILVHL